MSKKSCFWDNRKWWLAVMAAMLGMLSSHIGGARTVSWALEPPSREEMMALQEKPSELKSRLEFAERLRNHRVDPFLLKKAIINQERKFLQAEGKKMDEVNRLAPMLAPPPGMKGMPTIGNVRILAVLIEFTDFPHTSTRDQIHNDLFGGGDAARAPYESLAQYYSRASYTQLDLSHGTTLGWYRTAYDRSKVSQTDAGREELIKEVLNYYHSQGHDFRQYDNNRDGIIDYFVIIWTGPHNGWANFWWGYKTVFSDSNYKLDGVGLGTYSWQWEANPIDSPFTPLVVIHETGHALGLPDYYHYDSAPGPKGGVGELDMMDGNRGDHNCFSKWVLDWISPSVIASGTHTNNLNASGTSKDCLLIWPGIKKGNLFTEFFVAQNRQRVGNDAKDMPGDGMLIWHVDAALDPNGRDFLYDNSNTAHKLLRLMEASGREEIEKGSGKAGREDYYILGKQLGPMTTPSSKQYDGKDSNVEVTGVSPPSLKMSATFQIIGTP